MTTAAPSHPLHRARRLAGLIAALATVCTHALAQDEGQPTAPPAPAPVAQSASKTAAVADFRSCAKPEYPKASLRADQQGTVTLKFLIGSDGAVKDSKLERSSGFPLLDMAALDGIGRCKFKAGTVDGKAVEAWMTMQYVWKLDGPSPAKAAAALSRAREGAERGEAESQFRLGMMYMDGAGVARDPAQGMAWCRKAAEQGYPRAQLALGMALQIGTGGTPDLAQAIGWYRKAADQGMPEAQHTMGVRLLDGVGIAADKVAAREWLRKAAEQGLASSQSYYGMLLMEDGTPESMEQGIALLRKAVARNDATGQLILARCYESGNGVPRDDVQAVALYEKAALSGLKPAQRSLAGMYERGQGVAADPVKAAQWRQAAERPVPRPQ